MARVTRAAVELWPRVMLVAAALVLVWSWGQDVGPPVGVIGLAVVLVGTVLAALHQAGAVAHKVGEPFGTLAVAVVVTVIEVALIVTLMLPGGPGATALATDTVVAAVMITLNGIVGVSLLIGALRFGTALFDADGTVAALTTVASVVFLALVVPTFDTGRPGVEFSPWQLIFAAVVSLLLYGMFVRTQTGRHREPLLPVPLSDTPGEDAPAAAGTSRSAWVSLGLLLVALVAVVGLATVTSPAIAAAVAGAGVPFSLVGMVIALLVLLPGTFAAVRAAGRNQIQISLRLAFGSVMASIGLTIPAVAVAAVWLDGPVMLGLAPAQLVLLALTVVVSMLSVVPRRATALQAGVHLVLLAAYVWVSVNP
uniref:calcium:proton antiporter n=1 Tax=Rhodococcus opacus TaxID=37919 RepID=UPI003F65AEF7